MEAPYLYGLVLAHQLGFQIWDSLERFWPKVVMIPTDSSIPVGTFQVHEGQRVQGSSFSSTLKLGYEKGYVLLCHTGVLIFAKTELSDQLGLSAANLENPDSLFDPRWLKKRTAS